MLLIARLVGRTKRSVSTRPAQSLGGHVATLLSPPYILIMEFAKTGWEII
jgi:hypothetical protein